MIQRITATQARLLEVENESQLIIKKYDQAIYRRAKQGGLCVQTDKLLPKLIIDDYKSRGFEVNRGYVEGLGWDNYHLISWR